MISYIYVYNAICTSSFAVKDGERQTTADFVIVFIAGTCRLFGGYKEENTRKWRWRRRAGVDRRR